MIRLFLVDDEDEIRNNIIAKVSWEDNGIQICGDASNGREALDRIAEACPDIMLVDIRMPIMDGLELIESVSRNYANIKTIILSGFDDFSYAQKALRLGADDYLLKPCKPQDIISSVKKVFVALEEEKAHRVLLTRSNDQLKETLPLAKEKFLVNLISREYFDTDYIYGKLKTLGIQWTYGFFSVAVIRLTDFLRDADEFNLNGTSPVIIINCINETLSPFFMVETFQNSNDIVMIINKANSDKIVSCLSLLLDKLHSVLNINFSMGLGRITEDITKLHLCYIEAVKAVKASVMIGLNSLICFESIPKMYTDNTVYPFMVEKKILDLIKLPDAIAKIQVELEAFFVGLNTGSTPQEYIINASISLMLSVYKVCIANGISINEIFGHYLSYIDEIYTINNIALLKQKVIQILKNANQAFSVSNPKNQTVFSAIEYIKKNHMTDISLETVAEKVYVTPQYLSHLFKATININFVDYLNNYRIEKACELMRDSSMKTYDISSIVGYKDEKYFSCVFKKFTGMTPSQYRKSLQPYCVAFCK